MIDFLGKPILVLNAKNYKKEKQTKPLREELADTGYAQCSRVCSASDTNKAEWWPFKQYSKPSVNYLGCLLDRSLGGDSIELNSRESH